MHGIVHGQVFSAAGEDAGLWRVARYVAMNEQAAAWLPVHILWYYNSGVHGWGWSTDHSVLYREGTDADPTHSCILSVGMSAGIYSALPDILQFSMYKIK